MSSANIPDVPTAFSPLVKLNLPSPEEYNKRKVALISGALPAGLVPRSTH